MGRGESQDSYEISVEAQTLICPNRKVNQENQKKNNIKKKKTRRKEKKNYICLKTENQIGHILLSEFPCCRQGLVHSAVPRSRSWIWVWIKILGSASHIFLDIFGAFCLAKPFFGGSTKVDIQFLGACTLFLVVESS